MADLPHPTDTLLPPGLARLARAWDAAAPPVPVRLAATVVLLRDAPVGSGTGLEVWVQRRAASMAFAPGAHAFPGGGVDPVDRSAGPSALDVARAAAVRELAEETTLVLPVGRLLPWSRWVTPRFFPRRYDTYFFLAEPDVGTEPVEVSGEADHARWVSPRELLAALADGSASAFEPTRAVLTELAELPDVAAATARARAGRPLTPRLTGWVVDGADVRVVGPADPRYPGADVVTADRGVDPPWWCRLVRADNPGPMTLTGTNTYLLEAEPTGDAGVVVVDPGPALPSHLAALDAACAGRARAIVLTHHHRDHSEAADELAARWEVPVLAARPGLRRGGVALPGDGGLLPGSSDIRVRLTPGHTADSLCLQADRDGVRHLLTGDTVLGRGTTIVAHPDGALGPYLASLERLAGLLDAEDGVLLPGHGPVRADGAAVLREYREHRARRLDEVRVALASGARGVSEVTDVVYAEVDDAVRGAAEATVAAQLAHLGRLSEPDA